jgi:hypothetical protein
VKVFPLFHRLTTILAWWGFFHLVLVHRFLTLIKKNGGMIRGNPDSITLFFICVLMALFFLLFRAFVLRQTTRIMAVYYFTKG